MVKFGKLAYCDFFVIVELVHQERTKNLMFLKILVILFFKNKFLFDFETLRIIFAERKNIEDNF